MDKILYNLFYYKTLITSFIAPESSAYKAYSLFETPKLPPKVPQWEIEFDKTEPYNLIKIPYKPHIELLKKHIENKELPYEITRIPNFPEYFNVLEYEPDEKVPKREETIICVHGWDGRSLNYFKFIKKFQQKGFRVLAPDFPRHGKTGGEESGVHVFGHSLHALINYVNGPVYVLAHSLGNGAFCVNYAMSTPEELKLIKRYVGIGIPNKFTDIMDIFSNMIGLSKRAETPFRDVNCEMLGLDVRKMVVSEVMKEFNIPILLIHDENDKELEIANAQIVGNCLNYKKYKIGDKEYPCFYQSKGLGHRRIIRDEGIVDRVVEFFAEDNIQVEK